MAGKWHNVRVPFSEFAPVFRAKTLKDGAPVDQTRVWSIQLMLSKFEYDGALNPSFRPGPFELPIEYIAPYAANPVVSTASGHYAGPLPVSGGYHLCITLTPARMQRIYADLTTSDCLCRQLFLLLVTFPLPQPLRRYPLALPLLATAITAL